jgi:hypothetical protein
MLRQLSGVDDISEYRGEWLNAMKNTLRCLLISNNEENSDVEAGEGRETDIVIPMEESGTTTDNFTPAAQQAPSVASDEADREDASVNLAVVLDINGRGSNDGFVRLDPVSTCTEISDSDGYETLDPTDSSVWTETVTHLVPIPEVALESKIHDPCCQERSNGEDENLLVKIGGGLAIFGAVIGGVVLAAALHGDGNRDHEQKTKRSRETK